MLSTCISFVKLLCMAFALISTGTLLSFSLFPKSAFHFHLLIHIFNKYLLLAPTVSQFYNSFTDYDIFCFHYFHVLYIVILTDNFNFEVARIY